MIDQAPRTRLHRAVDLMAAMFDREVAAREEGRRIELDPRRRPEADRYFRRATHLYERRLRLGRSCGIL